MLRAVMELRNWLSLVAALGHLLLMVLAFVAGGESALTRRLGAFCFANFAWNFSTAAHHVMHIEAFSVMDSIFSALTPAFMLEVVTTFAGVSERHRRARWAAWLGFGSLAVASATALVSRRAFDWLSDASWSAWFGIVWLPTLAFALALLFRNLRASTDVRERARTRTMFAALVMGAAFSTSDIVAPLVRDRVALPPLGAVGTLVSVALITTVAVRFELLERSVSTRSAVNILVMIVVFVVIYVIIFRLLADRPLAQAATALVITAIFMGGARELSRRGQASSPDEVTRDVADLLAALDRLDELERAGGAASGRRELLDTAITRARRVADAVRARTRA